MKASTLQEIFDRRKKVWASEILPGLYLGGGRDAAELDELRAHKITCILNVADDVPNFHECDTSLAYCNLYVRDFGLDAGISRVFEQAFAFLDDCETNKKNVLVHCAAGVNRSATITIAWLMHSRHLTLEQAWLHTKQMRRGIGPLKDNWQQLIDFDQRLYGHISVDLDRMY